MAIERLDRDARSYYRYKIPHANQGLTFRGVIEELPIWLVARECMTVVLSGNAQYHYVIPAILQGRNATQHTCIRNQYHLQTGLCAAQLYIEDNVKCAPSKLQSACRIKKWQIVKFTSVLTSSSLDSHNYVMIGSCTTLAVTSNCPTCLCVCSAA